jgi:hypothetical protein
VFDLRGPERLNNWKEFRNSLETSQTPFHDVLKFWSKAPFVSPYLKTDSPESWPDPWHIVLDDRLDDLAITLGIMYTLQLTQRFMADSFEIHMSILPEEKRNSYYVIVNQHEAITYTENLITNFSEIEHQNLEKIWASSKNP